MNRFVAIVALLSLAAFGDGPSPVTKTRIGYLHPREGLVVTDIDLSAIGGAGVSPETVTNIVKAVASHPDDYTTTNAVKDIVTEEVVSYTEWTHGNVWENDDYDSLHGSLTNFGVAYIDGEWKMKISGSYSYEGAPKVEFNDEFVPCDNNDHDALEVAFTWDGVYLPSTRSKVTYNSLGLARLKDIGDLPTPQGVTNIVRDLSLGGIWDDELQVWWTPRMRNGSLTYEATTNVNLNAEN